MEVCVVVRKSLFNIFLVIEVIFNIKVLMVAFLFMCVGSTICSYNAGFTEQYGGYLLKANEFLPTVFSVVVVVSLLATSLKMLINETKKGIGLGFIKALVPFLVGITALIFTDTIVGALSVKFQVSSDYGKMLVYYLVAFWVLLLIIISKSVVNSNAGFCEITQLTGSNDVALKYFDGVLSDVNLEECDIIALKYEGDENNG